MSNERKAAIKICRRSAYYLMFGNSARSPEVLNARELIARCYEIS